MRKNREVPFYTTLKHGDVLTVNGIPLRVAYTERLGGGNGLVCLAVDAPISGEIEFDQATRSITRLTSAADAA